MKVAIGQIRSKPGYLEENAAAIIAYAERAREQGAEVILFPEGALPSYLHLDLVYEREFLKAIRTALEAIARAVPNITMIIGFVDSYSKKVGPGGKPILYNSAAVLSEGRIIAVRDKTLLPEYDVFSEHRYYVPGERVGLVDIAGRKIGIGICEDMWAQGYRDQVYPKLIAQGADLLVNLSASPFHVGKLAKRVEVIKEILGETGVPLLYANCVGALDGYDGELIFDGRSMIWNQHKQLIAQGAAFAEDLLIADLVHDKPVVTAEPSEDEELYAALVLGIGDYFARTGFETAYVGLSGGIDSAVVLALAGAALGASNVVAVTMPSHITSSETLADAKKLAHNLGISCHERSISAEYQAWLTEAEAAHPEGLAAMTKQNKQARIRGAILMEYTNQDVKGLVLSTGNKTEIATGYCTLYGDMCGALAPLSDVSKQRVYSLANYINRSAAGECIPERIIERPPTAELELGQTDAANLPADYDVLSPLVEDIVEQGLSRTALVNKYPAEIVDKTRRLVQVYEYKRRQAAPGVRVTPKAFGVGRRVPLTHG